MSADFFRGIRWHRFAFSALGAALCRNAALSQPHHILCCVSRAVQAINASTRGPIWASRNWQCQLAGIGGCNMTTLGVTIANYWQHHHQEVQYQLSTATTAPTAEWNRSIWQKILPLDIKNVKEKRPEQEAREGLALSPTTPPGSTNSRIGTNSDL